MFPAVLCPVLVEAAAPPATALVSVSTTGGAGNAASDSPAISADGACVAFQSAASDLVADDTNGVVDVFVRDLAGGTTARISVADDESQGTRHSYEPAVSADCRYIAFTSLSPNLVADDTNGVSDVFVRDRTTGTTTRVSLSPGGSAFTRGASSPSISGDGRWVAFDTAESMFIGGARVFVRDTTAGTTVEVADPPGRDLRQPSLSADGRYVAFMSYLRGSIPGDFHDDGVWLFDRVADSTRRVASATNPDEPLMGRPAIDADGRLVTFAVTESFSPLATTRRVHVFDRVTGVTTPLPCVEAGCWQTTRASFDSPGRQVALSSFGGAAGVVFDLLVLDRRLGRGVHLGTTTDYGTALTQNTREVSLNANASMAAFTANAADGLPAAPAAQVYVRSLDADRDSLPDAWETLYGLDPSDPADADGDGITNSAEYDAGSHPRGFYRRYLAEGATSDFFATGLAIAQPAGHRARVLLSFQRADHTVVRRYLESSSRAPLWLSVAHVAGMTRAEFGTLAESDVPIVVDRVMTWDRTRYGGHAETAQPEPRLTWHFAEGATHSGFDLFYLLQNPGAALASVEIVYLLPAPHLPVVKAYTVAASSRLTIWVDSEDVRLGNTDVSAIVRSVNDVPFLAERAMYLNGQAQTFAAGHDGFGIADLSYVWFFSEGATGAFFDEFITIANPNDAAADVEVTYLLPGGETIVKRRTVPRWSRDTVWVDQEDPRLSDTAVSATVRALNYVPLAVERVMWWPGPTAATWQEAHVVAGTTTTAHHWVIADGYVDNETDMFVLIGNISPVPDIARVTLYWEGGSQAIDYPIGPYSRTNAWINFDFGVPAGTHFAVHVESVSDIVVERASYWNAGGQFWAGGAAAMATVAPSDTTTYQSMARFKAEAAPNRRVALEGVAPGFYGSLTVGDVHSYSKAGLTVRAPGEAGFAQGSVWAYLQIGRPFIVSFPAGTRAAGLSILDVTACSGLQVSMYDGVSGGAAVDPGNVCQPVYVGFSADRGVYSITIEQVNDITIGGQPAPVLVGIGDILYARTP